MAEDFARSGGKRLFTTSSTAASLTAPGREA